VQRSKGEYFLLTKFIGSFGGAITTAFGSAVCCAGPTVAVSLGVSSAGLSAWVPYRPFFIAAAAAGFTYYAFHLYDRTEQAEGETGEACDIQTRSRMKKILWVSTTLVMFFAFSPFWIDWVL
jgi:hypothetical protein